MLNGAAPDGFIKSFLQTTFGAPAVLMPPQAGLSVLCCAISATTRAGAGFVLYRVTGNRIALWVAAVAGGEAGWAKPLTGAVVLSMRCASPGAPALHRARCQPAGDPHFHPLHPGRNAAKAISPRAI